MGEYLKPQKQRNPWTANQQKQPRNRHPNLTSNHLRNSENKFKEAANKYQAAAQKHAKDYESSSEEEELESQQIINKVFESYADDDVNLETLNRTKHYLEDAFISGAVTCLICISNIKRNDSIWSCSECYCSFHLMCIQRWSKDTITQKKLALDSQVLVRKIKIAWGCPKCRHDYEAEHIPNQYLCFCGKSPNPVFQSLLVPHSCGEKCRKKLKPDCGHQCLLLCHPGPCPPCPKTVTINCYCNSQPPKVQRCSNKEWSCGKPCNKLLECKKHKCNQPCHAGDCQPCPKKSIQKCLCGASQKLRDCAAPVWQCDKICNKLLECGFHNCSEYCHIGKCGSCELSKPRTCPCGKSSYLLPCTEETPTCEDTCLKLLECGQHVCYQKCHKDKCGSCVETVTKTCQCGVHTKEVPCKKPYLCETKCKQMKDCNKHPCNRKCCDGNCPPCEKPCGRTLSCGNHKCKSVCHRGPCYPCNLTEKVFCRCGNTFLTVPCGRKNRTRPPKCYKLCLLPPDCHHPKRENHNCHFDDCPPCRQICNKSHKTCSHLCPALCHTAVLVKIEGKIGSMPWEQTGPQFEIKEFPCPPCIVPMLVTCLGGHETLYWPCHSAIPSSCQRPCGRVLLCENHTCKRLCHEVVSAPDDVKAGENCDVCENECSKDRPDGCTHLCLQPCHPGACPPCKQMLRIKCHCGLNQPYVACNEWIVEENKEQLQSCGNQCPNNYACGHRCRSNCHSGPCPDPESCKKKVKVFCKCKRIKKEFPCETVKKGEVTVSCDDVCKLKKEEQRKQRELEQEQRKFEEDLKNRKELEKYEKIFHGKKKNRERKLQEDALNESLLRKYWPLCLTLIISFVTCVVYYCINY